MEWLIHITAFVLALLLGVVKSFQYRPAGMSEFELQRKAKAGDPAAVQESHRRALLPTLNALKRFKEILITLTLIILLSATQPLWLVIVLGLLYLFLAEVIAAKGWLRGVSHKAQRHLETKTGVVQKSAPFVRPLAHKNGGEGNNISIASRAELTTIINDDTQLLSPTEKQRIINAMEFDATTVADMMIPRDKIVTVEVSETVGPVLLDRLHKADHQVFPVTKKDLDHIQGLLNMSDVALLGTQVEKVKDALRPKVFYLPASEPLSSVVAASLQTGRQLFIVVGETGNTVGLITLADVLTKLLGEKPATDSPVTTDPKKV